jgi:hypothetical protein
MTLMMVSATPGHFFQPGKNSLSLKQLAGLPKTPWRDLPVNRVGDIGKYDVPEWDKRKMLAWF